MELINFCPHEKAERIVRITGVQDKREAVYSSPVSSWASAASRRYTFLERPEVIRDFHPPLNPSWGVHGNRSCCSACGVFLLLCLDFLHSNCFHMVGNVIPELSLVISSLSHQGFSATSPTLHPLMGSEEFHMTRWGHLWVFPHMLKTMGLVLMSVGSIHGTQRSLPDVCPTYAFMLCPCEDFSEAGAVKGGFFNCWIESFLLRMFLQTSALILSLGKADLGRTFGKDLSAVLG